MDFVSLISSFAAAIFSAGGIVSEVFFLLAVYQSWRVVTLTGAWDRNREQAAKEANERALALATMAAAQVELQRQSQTQNQILARIEGLLTASLASRGHR